MNLIKLSIERTVFAWILMSALIIFGAISLNRLGISQMPDVDFPVLNVSVSYEGAAPEVIESDIIDPMEQRLLSIEGLKEMRATVRQGQGSINLEFDINRDVDIALQEVQAALSQLRLPSEVDPPVIRKRNPEEAPIMFISVYADKPLREVLLFMENYFLDQIRFIPGVGEVSTGGFSERNVRIWPDPQKLKEADLTILDLADALQSQHLETAAGQFVQGERELRVRWLGEVTAIEDMKNLQILRRGGQVIQDKVYRLGDFADIEDGLSDIRRMARINGKEAVSAAIRKQRGSNEVAVGRAVEKRIEELKKMLPEGYQCRINANFTKPTEAVVHTTYNKLIIASAVTILVCLLFLGSWQATLNILFSIPTSIIGTFLIIYFSGFTLNLFTLLALTLAVSIVVDDAIMLLENIVRHYRMGKTPKQAAYEGAMEILPAATAASLAVVAVFLPVVFMDGIIGKFFYQFGVTMSAAVMLSLLEAVTITPMRTAAILAVSPKTSAFEHWLERLFGQFGLIYQRLLMFLVKFPKIIIILSTMVFIASMMLVRHVKQEFVPSQDQNFISITAQTPTGTSIEETARKALEIEKILNAQPEISGFLVSVGGGGGASEVNQMSFPTTLKDRKERTKTHQEIIDELRPKFKEIKGARVTMRDISARNLTSGRLNPVSFNLLGPDLKILEEKANELIKRLTDEKYAQDMDMDFKTGLPELIIRPNRAKMAERGVSAETVARTLNVAVAGMRQSRYTSDARRYDVRIKIPEQYVKSSVDIANILVRNQFGNLVPLSELVDTQESTAYQSITRINRQRAIGVFGSLGPGKAQGEVSAAAQTIAREILPEGYRLDLEGSSTGMSESFKSLRGALLMGILVAYMILAIQFNSFIHPITVLVALPFSLTGALMTLWMTGISLNLFSFIGIIVLMGIAKKNSILLVEFTNQIRQQNPDMSIRDALSKACPIRLRPILMTSVATVAAAFPLIIGNSIGQETRTPMGLTIIGGTIVSTIFTLFVVPCVYLVLSRFEIKKYTDNDRTA
ncbi:MAG: efflux RND transporter permease subunit [Candidatus Omnitrophica bacterium]|nr:efflux RND transporter permease subunit [Candidatus Omnitrophota bacterium]